MSVRTHPPADVTLSLALAVVAASSAPLLLLDDELRVVAASDSFCTAFALAPEDVTGRRIAELGGGEWGSPQLGVLLGATMAGRAAIDAYEMALRRPGQDARCVVLNAHKLDYAGGGDARVLLSVADVTEARLAQRVKEELLRDRAMLHQELQHRVANSLQIIASVLMQSARKVQSDEARVHLHDAHHRVMSVAAMQRQLATGGVGDVALRAYFTDLCRSIGASMIRDHNQISLAVTADGTSTSADVSMSLGLIVTELVINALKHAFPGQRAGHITVDYAATGEAWTLQVGDDGVGMPPERKVARAGLGSTIVGALAKQLDAEVSVTGAGPGTRVSVVHEADAGAAAVTPAV